MFFQSPNFLLSGRNKRNKEFLTSMFIMSLFILSFVTIKHTVPKFSTMHSELRETFVDPLLF